MIRKKTAIYLSNMIVLFSLGSCKHLDCNLPSFVDTFEAYRWLGYNEEKYEERRAKIMELLHNSEAETSATGTDSVPCIDFSLPYILCVLHECNLQKFHIHSNSRKSPRNSIRRSRGGIWY